MQLQLPEVVLHFADCFANQPCSRISALAHRDGAVAVAFHYLGDGPSSLVSTWNSSSLPPSQLCCSSEGTESCSAVLKTCCLWLSRSQAVYLTVTVCMGRQLICWTSRNDLDSLALGLPWAAVRCWKNEGVLALL